MLRQVRNIPHVTVGAFLFMKGVNNMRKHNMKHSKLARSIRNKFDTAYKKWNRYTYDNNDDSITLETYLKWLLDLSKTGMLCLNNNQVLRYQVDLNNTLPYWVGDDKIPVTLEQTYYPVKDIIRKKVVYMNNKGELLVCCGCGQVITDDDYIETSDTGHIYCTECEDLNYYKCEKCGDYFDEEYYEAHNNENYHICHDCFENRGSGWFKCEDCEEVYRGRSYTVYDGQGYEHEVCVDCRNDNYTSCDRCGRYVENDYVHDHNGTNLCEDCEENYRFCTDCDCILGDYEGHMDDEGDWFCDSCWDDRYGSTAGLLDYHGGCNGRGGFGSRIVGAYGMSFMYEGENRSDNPIIGIEDEIAGAGERGDYAQMIREKIGTDYCICSMDSSLDEEGFEIVSCPADLYNHRFTIDWRAGFTKARGLGYTSHDNGLCGLHTHIDRQYFEHENQSDVEGKFIVVFRNNLWWLKNFSRRDDYNPTKCDEDKWYYCEPNGDGFLDTNDKFDKQSVKHKKFMDSLKKKDHYLSVNFEHDNTIELRLFRGTLKYNTFIGTLEFVDMFCRLIKGKDIEDVTDITLATFIDMAREYDYEEFLTYLNERNIRIDNEPKRKVIRYINTNDEHYIDYPM